MNLQLFKERIKGILVDPGREWQQIKSEQQSNKELLLYYVLPFAAVAAVISFIVVWLSTYLGFGLALRFGVLKLVMPIIIIVVAAVVMNELSETFNSTKNLNNAFKLVTYSYTPALLAAIIASFSWTLGWVMVFGLYGAYLLWVGLPKLMDTPDDKRLVYIIAAVALVIVIKLILGAIFGIERLGYY